MIPDAPWIREAEMYGMPDSKEYCCPVCGAENPDTYYKDGKNGDIIGCENCIDVVDAYEWECEHEDED